MTLPMLVDSDCWSDQSLVVTDITVTVSIAVCATPEGDYDAAQEWLRGHIVWRIYCITWIRDSGGSDELDVVAGHGAAS